MVLMMGIDRETSRCSKKEIKKMMKVAIDRARCRCKGRSIVKRRERHGEDCLTLGDESEEGMLKSNSGKRLNDGNSSLRPSC
jgi:hypothetical protein